MMPRFHYFDSKCARSDLSIRLFPQLCYSLPRFFSGLLLSIALMFIPATTAMAAGFTIEKATANFNQNALSVNAKFDLNISDAVDEALHNGVSIDLITTLDLYAKRRYMWNERIAQWVFSHQISYHSLTRRYVLSSPQTAESSSFSSLEDLLNQVETFSFQSDILADTLPKSKSGYNLQLRIALDKSALPTPLRVMTIISPAWRLKSKVHEWSVEG